MEGKDDEEENRHCTFLGEAEKYEGESRNLFFPSRSLSTSQARKGNKRERRGHTQQTSFFRPFGSLKICTREANIFNAKINLPTYWFKLLGYLCAKKLLNSLAISSSLSRSLSHLSAVSKYYHGPKPPLVVASRL